MKTIKIILMLLCAVAISGCKQNNWLDWKTKNELWLQQNAKSADVITTPTGLQYRQIFEGPYANDPDAVRPDNAKIVTVKYSGKLINGYEFDSNESADFYVSDLVAGFTEGLKKMNKFDIYEFYIPYDLGYGIEGSGTEGTSSHIPPYSTLIFRVELLNIY